MAEGRIDSRIESDDEFGEQVMSEIGSLREDIVAIRQMLERGHSLNKAVEEYRYLPSGLENPIRWVYIGVWGKGGSWCSVNVITTRENDYFDKPHASDEIVAEFAAVFSHHNTIKVCKYLFRNEEHSRKEIKRGCKLSDEELDAAVEPLLGWHFVEWRDDKLESVDQGITYAITLVGMAQVAFDNKVRCEAGTAIK